MKSCFCIAISVFFYSLGSFGQNAANASLYNAFDKVSGRKNSGLCNGTIYMNPYRSADNTHRYYGTDKYTLGDVVYDNQPYFDVLLKYDLLEDGLIVKMDGNNNMGFNLIPEKIASFHIDDRTFANLDLVKPHPDYIKGFYEESASGLLKLYTKYGKERKEVLTGEVVLNTYYPKYDFILAYKNSWYKVNSQKDVTEIFPDYTNSIADYYLMHAALEKSDAKQFMKNLFGYINSLLNKAQE
jgi:hypothetical protein